eukprot:5175061-Pleurochrysis_carterae.AAC.1
MPGRSVAPPCLGTYRTYSNVLNVRYESRKVSPSPVSCASPPAEVPTPTESLPSDPSAPSAPPDALHDVKRTPCAACVDLHISSSPRALVATRTARLSDRHSRNLRKQGRHIGFVVDSGCTYHIHPHLQDL